MKQIHSKNIEDHCDRQLKLISEQHKLIRFLEEYYLETCEEIIPPDCYPIYDILKKYDYVFKKNLDLEHKDMNIGLSQVKVTTDYGTTKETYSEPWITSSIKKLPLTDDKNYRQKNSEGKYEPIIMTYEFTDDYYSYSRNKSKTKNRIVFDEPTLTINRE